VDSDIKFSWDEKKAKSNLAKHQVSFEEIKQHKEFLS